MLGVRNRAAVLAAFVAVIVVGCGGSTGPSLKANGPVTKAEATTYGNAVNLGVADVHGYTPILPTEEHTHLAAPSAYARCVHERMPEARDVATVESPAFRLLRNQRISTISSRVAVFPTTVGKAVAVHETPRVHSCYTRTMRQAMIEGFRQSVDGRYPFSFGALTTYRRVRRLSGTPVYEQGWAVPSVVTAPGDRPFHIHYYGDQFSFAVGPATIRLSWFSDERAFPSSEAQRLLKLLYARARTS